MENQNELQNNKKGNGLVVVVIILILLVLALGGYICYDKLLSNKQVNEPNQAEEKKDNKETEESKQLETFDISKFDGSQVINGNSDVKYSSQAMEASNSEKKSKSDGTNIEFLKAELQSDSKSIIANVNWAEMYFDRESKNYTYIISNFNNKIRKVYVSGWGQAMGADTIFYLMEDGTVEYTPITSKIVKESVDTPDTVILKSYGKIQNVEDVVMIATVSAGPANSQTGGYMALVGIKADGSFYDISKILDQTAEYKY